MTVGLQNAYARDWVESRLTSTMVRILAGIMNQEIDLRFTVIMLEPKVLQNAKSEDELEVPKKCRTSASGIGLCGRYTFDNFAVSANNRVAHAAALAITESQDVIYNPFVIYGSNGLGKTHLAHALSHKLLAKGLNVLCVSGEQFVNEFILALMKRTMEEFRDKYRTPSVLLIDDFHRIQGKEKSAEEFLNTIKELLDINDQKRVIITCEKDPATMRLENGLRDRLASGFSVEIKPPGYEARRAVLEVLSKNWPSLKIPTEILDLVALRVTGSIRELEGALNRITLYARLQELTVDIVNYVVPVQIKTVDGESIIETVAQHFGLTKEDIISTGRHKSIAHPRKVCMYFLREILGLALKRAGALLNLDHTTIMYDSDSIKEKLQTDVALQKQILEIKKQLNMK